METTQHGSDLRGKADQPYVPPGGSSSRTFFSGARQAGNGLGLEANVTPGSRLPGVELISQRAELRERARELTATIVTHAFWNAVDEPERPDARSALRHAALAAAAGPDSGEQEA